MAARSRRCGRHPAASTLTLQDGPDGVTVARIADAAGISPRTFFNYFESKEDAILGITAPSFCDEAVAGLLATEGRDRVLRVALLVADVAGRSLGPAEVRDRRAELLTRYPALRARLGTAFTASRELVARVMVDEPETPWRGAPGLPADPTESRALVSLAGAAVSFAWRLDPELLVADRESALASAITILRKAMNPTS